MKSFEMHRFTIVAPDYDNEGNLSTYAADLRRELLYNAIDGWTEYQTRGAWRGVVEPGKLFEIYRETTSPRVFANLLGEIGRSVMPDQEAVQVTHDPNTINVYEA